MKNQHPDPTYIKIGKLGSSYGVRGWLKISAYTEFGPDILNYPTWYLSKDGQHWKAYEVEEGKEHGKGIIAKLAGIHSPEEARLLTGMFVGILRSDLPKLEQGDFYWSDLIGLTVINKDGAILGNVSYLIETGANDVLVVKGTKEHAIPYLPGTVILNVDLKKQEIQVDWEGL